MSIHPIDITILILYLIVVVSIGIYLTTSASGLHAAHIIEIMEAIDTSIVTKQAVDIQSSFTQPEMMDWVT